VWSHIIRYEISYHLQLIKISTKQLNRLRYNPDSDDVLPDNSLSLMPGYLLGIFLPAASMLVSVLAVTLAFDSQFTARFFVRAIFLLFLLSYQDHG
jgi:hypothetical protein